jgi:hypothetical protein
MLAVSLVTACGALPPFDAAANESRLVRVDSDPSKSLVVPDGMVWYASSARESGIRFPPGTYSLEAEDDDYWYFKSPAPLEFRRFAHGAPIEQHSNAGGLMLAKQPVRAVPAGGYIDADTSNKTLVWKLGRSFLAMEGRQWRKSW